jgi:hypothetical protein
MFLGKVTKLAQTVLGKAGKGLTFLGKNAANISKGLRQVSSFAANPAVQKAGGSLGIRPSVFRAIGDGAAIAGGAVPQAQQTARDLAAAAVTGKRSVADLYAKLN